MEVPRSTETGEAPGGQARRGRIPSVLTESQRRPPGCSARRMPRDFRRGLPGNPHLTDAVKRLSQCRMVDVEPPSCNGATPAFHGFPCSVRARPLYPCAFQEVLVIRRHLSMRFVALAALLVLVPAAAARMQGQASAPAAVAQARVVAMRGGTVLTVTGGTIANGTVLVRDGKIAAVGANVADSAGRRGRRRHRQVRLARHHRRPLAHRHRRASTRAACR